jgi:uncharacterized SAM-binding protein YcdF (DUF218 family)
MKSDSRMKAEALETKYPAPPKTRRRAILVVLALLLAWLCVAWIAARGLIVKAELQQADAIAVLAGSSTYVERTHRAAQLFREGRAGTILLTNDNLRSGWSGEEQRNPFFVELAVRELNRQGVPSGKIQIIPGGVMSTYDEALHLREYAISHGLRSILVVTSAYHSRRVWWTLRRVFAGSNLMIGVAPAEPEQSPSAATWWLHKFGWKSVPGEYVKIIYYWWRY